MKWIVLSMLVFSMVKLYSQDHKTKMKPENTEVWSPVPEVIQPGSAVRPPSDAINLFDGTSLDKWCSPKNSDEKAKLKDAQGNVLSASTNDDRDPASWQIIAGEVEVVPGSGAMETRQSFGSIQLHIEWLSPVDKGKKGQEYSNSGVFLMGLYEIQVLNSFENKTYSNGMAGAVYKQHVPLVNPANPPGEWQTYDIIFTAPEFETHGYLKSPAYVTVLWNGVLVQNHVEIQGPTLNIGYPKYIDHAPKLPLRLQDHSDKVRYRNIWVRELNE